MISLDAYFNPNQFGCHAIDICHAATMLSPKLCFCTSKLVLKFFTARLDVQNVLFLC